LFRIIYKVPQTRAISLHFAKTKGKMRSLDENNTLEKGKKHQNTFSHQN
jgi:hypothetical protein